MKIYLLLILAALSTPVLAQRTLRYTIWADGVVNPQLPNSSLYFIGTGIRGEVSKPLGKGSNALFAQVGYVRFPQKAAGAFTANTGLVNIGYRYQSRKAFGASIGVGAQYWNQQMRVRFADYSLNETFNHIMPSATVGLSIRVKSRYALGLEYRGLLKPESGTVTIRNNVAFSLGYTL